MTVVMLSWDDPDEAAEFLRLREDLRRHGWLGDNARAALVELVGASEVRDGSEEGADDAAV